MLTDSDMFGLYDRFHFCKHHVSHNDIIIYDNPILKKDNSDTYEDRYNRKVDALNRFYVSGALFMDVLLAGKIHYLGNSFSAKNSFDWCKYERYKKESTRLGLMDDDKYGSYNEEQLRFALTSLEQLCEEHPHRQYHPHYMAVDFILNSVLDTKKFPLSEQMRILLDDWYCEVLEEEGLSTWM